MQHALEILRQLAIVSIPLLLGIILHELAHGYVAYLQGDPTAKMAGRLSLNPLKHLDPLGLAVLIITRTIGWAKPVPINPNNFKNLKRGLVLVAIAGPAVNFILAFGFWLIFKFILYLNPLGHSLWQQYLVYPLFLISSAGVVVNIILGVFNLIPIPPLDGSKILAYFLPAQWLYQYLQMEKYGFILLLVLILSGGFSTILNGILNYIYAHLLVY